MVVGILYHIPNRFYKNLNSQYYGIAEEYNKKQKEGKGIIFLHVIFATKYLFVVATSFSNNQAFSYHLQGS